MLQEGCALLGKNVGVAINLDSPQLQLKLDFYLRWEVLVFSWVTRLAKDKVNWRKGPAEKNRGLQIKNIKFLELLGGTYTIKAPAVTCPVVLCCE